MSLEIILVPIAIALITKAHSKSSESTTDNSAYQVGVETRMKNQDLLEKAMGSIGCTTSVLDNEVAARLNAIEFSFKRNTDGIWVARFNQGTTVDSANEIIHMIDKAYGIEVQSEVLRKIRERAPLAGMSLESETINEDSSVTLLLAVNQ